MFLKRTWICFIIIIVLYWCTYQGHEGFKYLLNTPGPLKHIISFSLLVLVGLVGFFGWYAHPQVVVKRLWVLLYFMVIVILSISGLVDVLYHIDNPSLRDFFYSLRMFFTSPVPYGILMFLAKHLDYKN